MKTLRLLCPTSTVFATEPVPSRDHTRPATPAHFAPARPLNPPLTQLPFTAAPPAPHLLAPLYDASPDKNAVHTRSLHLIPSFTPKVPSSSLHMRPSSSANRCPTLCPILL